MKNLFKHLKGKATLFLDGACCFGVVILDVVDLIYLPPDERAKFCDRLQASAAPLENPSSSDEGITSEMDSGEWNHPGLFPLTDQEYEPGRILPGEVFLILSGGKPVRVALEGGLLPEKYRNKPVGQRPDLRVRIPDWFGDLESAVSDLLAAFQKEEESYDTLLGDEVSRAFGRWMLTSFRDGIRDENGLDLILICQEVLGDLPKELVLPYEGKDVQLFRRALKVAAIGVHLALLLGYFERETLRKVWISFFSLDASLVDGDRVHGVEVHDRLLDWAKKGELNAEEVSPENLKTLLKHSLDSVQSIRNRYAPTKNWDFRFQMLPLFHHENFEGLGPIGVSSSSLMELEKVSILADRLAETSGGDWMSEVMSIRQGLFSSGRARGHSLRGLCPVLVQRVADSLTSLGHAQGIPGVEIHHRAAG